jgi:hypothetical protein
MSTEERKATGEAENAEIRIEDLNAQSVEPSAAEEVKGGASEIVVTKTTDSASAKLFHN